MSIKIYLSRREGLVVGGVGDRFGCVRGCEGLGLTVLCGIFDQ